VQQSDQLAASLVQSLIARACSSEAIASALWWQLKLQSQPKVDTPGNVTALYVQVMQQLEVSEQYCYHIVVWTVWYIQYLALCMCAVCAMCII
jgi:hypothetical protein